MEFDVISLKRANNPCLLWRSFAGPATRRSGVDHAQLVGSALALEMLCDPTRYHCSVTPNTTEQRRRQVTLEGQAYKVKTGASADQPGMMQGITILSKDRKMYPPEVRAESRAPQDTRHVEYAAALQ